ncbi:MAG: rhodanese-like domain-containing protein [Pseudomonadota bacterium]
MQTLSPSELQQRLARGEATVVDVRESPELELAQIKGAVHLPLSELAQRWTELKPLQQVVLICHHGVRSERAGRFLQQQGLEGLAHLEGGIDAWSEQIDSNVARY